MGNRLLRPKTSVTGQTSCAECGGKVSPANSHSRCVRCTRCSPDQCCDVCRLWSDDRWAEVLRIENLTRTNEKTDSVKQPKLEQKTDSEENPVFFCCPSWPPRPLRSRRLRRTEAGCGGDRPKLEGLDDNGVRYDIRERQQPHPGVVSAPTPPKPPEA